MAIKELNLIHTAFGAVEVRLQDNQLAINLLSQGSPLSPQSQVPVMHPLVQHASQQVMQYLQQPSTSSNLSFSQHGTVFQQRVWQAIAEIPCGETRSYSDLAKQIGSGSRAVANACGANKLPLLVPCHRVVAKHGIGGFMRGKQYGLKIKQWLLRHEGVHRFDCE